MRKPLPEAVADFSRERGGPSVLVIEIREGVPGRVTDFDAQQASCSGELAKKFAASAVLRVIVAILEATAVHYRRLLTEALEAEALAERGRG